MDVLLQNFSQEIAGDMSGLLFLTAESVVGIGHQVPFALLVQIVETLTIGVRHYSVGIAMQDALGSVVVLGRLVDRQSGGCADIVATQGLAVPHLYLGWRILGVVHLAECIATQGIVTEHGGRGKEHHGLYLLDILVSLCD